MEDIRKGQRIAIANLTYAFQHFWKARPGDHCIVDIEIRSQPPHGSKSPLPGPPEMSALFRTPRHGNLSSALLIGHLADPQQLTRQLTLCPIQLNDQDSPGIHGKAGRIDTGFNSHNRSLVHHLKSSGHHAGTNHPADQSTRRRHIVENHKGCFRRFRNLGQPHRHLGHDTQGAFTAHNGSHQIVTG